MEITCFTTLEEHVQLCNTESLAGSRSVDSVSVYIGYGVTACVIATSGASLVERSCWGALPTWKASETEHVWRAEGVRLLHMAVPYSICIMLMGTSIPNEYEAG
jgi:hypothetical protein